MAIYGASIFGEDVWGSPGSVLSSRVPWYFRDLSSGDIYEMPINPLDVQLPGIERPLTTEYTTSGKPVSFEGRQKTTNLSASGTILREEHLNAVNDWFALRKQIQIRDDLGRNYHVYLVGFSPKRIYTSAYPWRHEFSLEAVVLDWQ